jgi:acetyl esterase
MPLDPQARAYLEEQERLGIPPIWELGVEQAGRNMEETAPTLVPFEDVASVEDATAGSVPVRIYRPEAAGAGALVWFHGGGWVVGSIDTHDGICRQLANRAGCTIVSAGYRLAPEHRFPAAVEDAWEVTAWAAETFDTIAIGGDSAGGQLTAVVALGARRRGIPLALQVLVYPALASSYDTPSYEACATGYGLTREAMRWYWEQYLGSADGSAPDASPLLAPDLADAPPALVLTAEYDPLRDEGEAYAQRLKEADVPVSLRRYDGQIHGFFRMTAIFDAARAAVDETAAAVRAAL